MTSDEFVFEYLKADQDTGTGAYEIMIAAIQTLEWEKVKPHIVKLKYFYFLKSSYWRVISEEIKRRSGRKCACGCRENLQVHHTEEGDIHHGEEHLLKGLVCLCRKCHQGLHGTSVKISEKKRYRSNQKEQILAQLSSYPKRTSEENITGSSFSTTRTLLEELEYERKIIIERSIYEGWKLSRP